MRVGLLILPEGSATALRYWCNSVHENDVRIVQKNCPDDVKREEKKNSHSIPTSPPYRLLMIRNGLSYSNVMMMTLFSVFAPDASQYAHYVFKTFKNGTSGTIKFEVMVILYKSIEILRR